MDGHALTLGLVFLAACQGARAENADQHDPRHGIDVPAAWRELPEAGAAAVEAARAVLGEDANAHAHAWGEPSRGCYLAIVEVHAARKDRLIDVTAELQNALGTAFEVTEWTTSPDAEDVREVQARLRGMAPAVNGIAGRLRAHAILDGQKIPHAVAAACFYNDRQPTVCDDACVPLIAMLAPLEVSP